MYSLDNVFDAEEWQGFLKRLDNAQEGLSMLFGVTENGRPRP